MRKRLKYVLENKNSHGVCQVKIHEDIQFFHGEEPHGHVIVSCPLLFMECNMPLSGFGTVIVSFYHRYSTIKQTVIIQQKKIPVGYLFLNSV